MTEAELNEIESRCQAATPGPWQADNETMSHAASISVVDPRTATGYRRIAYLGAAGLPHRKRVNGQLVVNDTREQHKRNGEFIAHAREDVPTLIAEIRELRRRLASVSEI